ncbi:polysaccharide deacetylase family protein [Rufibacter sp. LB8]|uniref:polysaccharide deacetylase family protein n=1 Tax=Rufibacter sp. LB8 TaxID=2777781 RepID=UPI00178C7FBE|nr:polysaccharide deacetylase family protein [Rufibacter sp. LB8]
MDLLFDYVLFHFKHCYHLPEPLELHYGLDGKSLIQIASHGAYFFEGKEPYPPYSSLKSWNGTSISLFFEKSPEQDWFTQGASGNVVVNFDLVAGAFYLLSGWQEFHSQERDRFGRFPYQASMQHKHCFVTLPVVNYYFDILRAAVEKAYGISVAPKTWPGHSFMTCLTHDIDSLQSAWKVVGKPALLRGDLGLFLDVALQKIKGEDAFNNLAQVDAELQKLNAKGSFYFLPNSQKVDGHPNSDYDIRSPRVQLAIKRLSDNGHEIGLHGSHGTSTNASQLKTEKKFLPPSVTGNRFHYLRFDPEITPSLLEELEFGYDSSLGFAEHFGFRNSYCLPFRLFDVKQRRMTSTWELPLNLMDITLNHPNYLQLSAEEVLPVIKPMLFEIKKFNGVFTLLWHNENFTPYGLPHGLQLFREITQEVQRLGSGFQTANQTIHEVQQR